MEYLIPQTVARLLVPLTIFRYPLIGILLSMGLDTVDWKLIDTTNPSVLAIYQNWDKALDFYFQLIVLYIVFGFKDGVAKKTAIALFAIRITGVALYYLTGMRQFLFFFPNLFDNFVVVYLGFVFLTKKEILYKSKKLLVIVLITLFVPKIFHEYYLHFLKTQPWDLPLYNLGTYVGTAGAVNEYANYIFWGFLLYVIPITITIFVLGHLLQRKNS